MLSFNYSAGSGVGMIVGESVGGLILLILIIVIVVFIRKR